MANWPLFLLLLAGGLGLLAWLPCKLILAYRAGPDGSQLRVDLTGPARIWRYRRVWPNPGYGYAAALKTLLAARNHEAKAQPKKKAGPGRLRVPAGLWLRLPSLWVLWRRLLAANAGLLRRVRVQSLSWHTEVGVGDPAQTAVLCGALWSIKGYLAHNLAAHGLAAADLQVLPHLTGPATLECRFRCIVVFRPGHIIIATLASLPLLLKLADQVRWAAGRRQGAKKRRWGWPWRITQLRRS